VAFTSDAASLTSFDPPLPSYISLHDRSTGTTTLRSTSFTGAQSTGVSFFPFISSDGRHILFESSACDLIPGDFPPYNCFDGSIPRASGDLNQVADVFVQDRDSDGNGIVDEPGGARIVRVSVATDGTEANGQSGGGRMSISSDGRFVAFPSQATNLVTDDTNTFCGSSGTDNCTDVFVNDRDVDGNGVFDEPGGIKTIRVNLSSTANKPTASVRIRRSRRTGVS